MIFFYRCETHGRYSIEEERGFDDKTPYACPECGASSERVPMPIQRSNIGLKIKKGRFFSMAFGKEFMSEREEEAFARDHGHIPVGDEPVEKLNAKMEKELSQRLDAPYESYQERVEITTSDS